MDSADFTTGPTDLVDTAKVPSNADLTCHSRSNVLYRWPLRRNPLRSAMIVDRGGACYIEGPRKILLVGEGGLLPCR